MDNKGGLSELSRRIIADYYAAHRNELVAYVAARTNDRELGQDLVQEGFLRLLHGNRPITVVTLPSLVYTVTRNLVTDHFRHRRVWNEYERYAMKTDKAPATAESSLSVREITERMERGLLRLPTNCREVYRMHILGGMKTAEISQALGEGYRSVEHRLGHARHEIRKMMRACM